MNKYHSRSLHRFDVRDSQPVLSIRWQVEQWNVKTAVVSYKSGRNPKGEKERRMEQGILTADTCLFMCMYECDEGCIQSSVPSCIEQILIPKAYLFASCPALRTCVLRIPPPPLSETISDSTSNRGDVYP